MQLSKLAQHQTGSIIRQMFNRALEIPDTISFTVGEPDFITPSPIIDVACENWKRGLTHYTPNSGIAELRKAIAQYHQNDLMPDPDTQIMVGCGATEVIQMALFTIVDPGDEVLVVAPVWPNYLGQIKMCGAVAKLVPSYEKNRFIPTLADIEAAITPRTKCLILNSPSNPTGAVMEQSVVEQIADLVRDRDIYIIADEVYSRLVYSDNFYSITKCEGLQDRIIYINSFSKMFAMTGWRLGYAVAAPEIIGNMTKMHENGASCLPAPSQIAAAWALLNCDSEIQRMCKIYRKRRDLMCDGINRLVPGMSCIVPEGAFYVFANIKATGMSSVDFCMDLLEETGVVIVPGSGFGAVGEGFVRFTYATSEENISEGISRIAEYMKRFHI